MHNLFLILPLLPPLRFPTELFTHLLSLLQFIVDPPRFFTLPTLNNFKIRVTIVAYSVERKGGEDFFCRVTNRTEIHTNTILCVCNYIYI